MEKFELCEKRKQILASTSHSLVKGGPGSGKTTIALLKAKSRIDHGLEAGQGILFLSFSRAAIARIIDAAKNNVPKEAQKLIHAQTFHSFFWEIVRTHGYLVGAPKQLQLLVPHDEKALSNGISRSNAKWNDWEREREGLFISEGRVAFDLFAPKAAQLLRSSKAICKIIGRKYPLIIVDEAQDTGLDQWECIKALSPFAQILCLADNGQQIFDFLPNFDKERIAIIERELSPLVVDFGNENNRSPDTGIASFAYDVLKQSVNSSPYDGVSKVEFNPRPDNRDIKIRQVIGMLNARVEEKTGRNPENIALFATYEKGVTIISNALQQGSIPHKVLFDEASTLLSSQLLAFLMEPKFLLETKLDIAIALRLLSNVFKAKGNVSALKTSAQLEGWTSDTLKGTIKTKAKLYTDISSIIHLLQDFEFTGNPRKDWTSIRMMLRNTQNTELIKIDNDLQYLMAFNRGKIIATGLTSAWERHGSYRSAREILNSAIAEDQIIGGGLSELGGIHVMTIHKAKGKQFDAVAILNLSNLSPVIWPNDPHPHMKSRKILHVGITRAKFHTMILSEPYPKCPILSRYKF